MDDLITFLEARLDEDEATANEVHLPRTCGSVDRDGDFDPNPVYCGCGYPARVLREVEAGRKILRLAAKTQEWTNSSAGATAGYAAVIIVETLHALAAIYSDHADYRAEWKP